MFSPSPPSSTSRSSRASTPTTVVESATPFCTLSDIIAQLSNENDQVKFQCLAYKRLGNSSNYFRCLKSSQDFEARHQTLYKCAVQVLSKETVTSFEYASTVIRIFFCDTHHRPKVFNGYYQIEASWNNGSIGEQRELLDVIRRICKLKVLSDPTPEALAPGLFPLPHRNRVEIEPASTASRQQPLPTFQFHTTPKGIFKLSENVQSAPQIPTMATMAKPSIALKPRTLFPLSVQARHTRSRSNPPPRDSNITQDTQNSGDQQSPDLHPGTSFPKTLPQVHPPLFQSRVSEPSRAFPGLRSSSQASFQDVRTHDGTLNGDARQQKDVPQGPFNFRHPQVTATRPGQKDSSSSTEAKKCSTSFFRPLKEPFDFNSPMPEAQASIPNEFTPKVNGFKDVPVSIFDIFHTGSPPSPSPNEKPKPATKPVTPRFNAQVPAPSRIIGSVVPQEEDPATEAHAPTLIFSSTHRNGLDGPHTPLQSFGMKETLGPQSAPQLQRSKDDTYLGQAAKNVARPPPLAHANTDSQIPAPSSTSKDSQTLSPLEIDSKIRAEIKREVNEEGHIYILKAPKYSQDYFPGEPSMLKIGRATDIAERMQTLSRTCKLSDLKRVQDPEDVPLRMYEKIEKLVHAELQNFSRVFECQGCGARHKEWFAVTEEVALKTVQRWRKFIQQKPYDGNGILKDYWSQKILDINLPSRKIGEKSDDCKDQNERWTKWLDEGEGGSNYARVSREG
ncbi:T5orf172 domain-containing protein [Bisporella sp. PMI_857]|nr:T5orf172 domain-containing protein [Bisporella sp. PMI_857]